MIPNKCILAIQKDAEESLAEALPALEAARIALQDLDKSDVTEIRWVRFYLLTSIEIYSNGNVFQ